MRCALSLMVILLAAITATAGDSQIERETLRGVNGVSVVVEDVKPDAEADGLTKMVIQTDVELKLRQAGIKVLTKGEEPSQPGMPFLSIYIQTLKLTGANLYAYRIAVSLEQSVLLLREPKITAVSSTWSAGGLGTVGSAKLPTIRENLKDHVDQFINAWLSVNPK